VSTYDRRDASDDARNLVELAEKSLQEFRTGMAGIEAAQKTAILVKQTAMRNLRGPDQVYRAVYEDATAIVDEIDRIKVLDPGRLLQWFGEFVSQTRARLQR